MAIRVKKKRALDVEPGDRVVAFWPNGRYTTLLGAGNVDRVFYTIDHTFITIDGDEKKFDPFEALEVQA